MTAIEAALKVCEAGGWVTFRGSGPEVAVTVSRHGLSDEDHRLFRSSKLVTYEEIEAANVDVLAEKIREASEEVWVAKPQIAPVFEVAP
jgi:hypothetical protein